MATPKHTLKTISIFGLRVRNASLREAAEWILERAEAGVREKVYFVNAHCVNVAARDAGYREVLLRADTVYADGSGLALATRVAGQTLRDNVNGTDLFPVLCEMAAARGLPIALLGARPEIVSRCAERMTERFPGLNIACALDGYFGPENETEVIDTVNQSGARLLFVAQGVPRQELWIDRVRDRLEAPQVLAVGGLFDFYSGLRTRAPWIVRQLGLEWTVRLAQEPRRLFRRYVLGNPEFLLRTLRLRLRGRAVLRERLS